MSEKFPALKCSLLCQEATLIAVCGPCCSVGFSITEDEAQEALLGAVSQRCCYGNTPAKEMDIYQIVSSCALHVSTVEHRRRMI